MKKTEYQKPEVIITKVNLENLLGSISGDVYGNHGIGYDGPGSDDDDPSAKGDYWDD